MRKKRTASCLPLASFRLYLHLERGGLVRSSGSVNLNVNERGNGSLSERGNER